MNNNALHVGCTIWIGQRRTFLWQRKTTSRAAQGRNDAVGSVLLLFIARHIPLRSYSPRSRHAHNALSFVNPSYQYPEINFHRNLNFEKYFIGPIYLYVSVWTEIMKFIFYTSEIFLSEVHIILINFEKLYIYIYIIKKCIMYSLFVICYQLLFNTLYR